MRFPELMVVSMLVAVLWCVMSIESEMSAVAAAPLADEYKDKTVLLPPHGAAFPQARGQVERDFDMEEDETEQELEVDVEGLPDEVLLIVRVRFRDALDYVEVGQMKTDDDGEAQLEVENHFPAPEGKDVRDICDVEVLLESNRQLLLKGNFCRID